MSKKVRHPHHEAWLSAHPHRSRRWLREKTKEGFDVHHLDGDHENNDPKNLVLIEHTDHMALHNGGTYFLGRLTTRRRRPPIEISEDFGISVSPRRQLMRNFWESWEQASRRSQNLASPPSWL